MLLTIFQNNGPSTGEIITYSILGVGGMLLCVLFLKMGLAAVKAERRRNFKWLLASFFIQCIVIFMMGSPFILLGFADAMENGPPPGIIAFVILTAIFIDMNVINVLHRTGLGKAFLPFLLMAIPIALSVTLGFVISEFKAFIPI